MSEPVLHIVLGDSAAGSLKHACTKLGMPGDVFAIPDELSHGPLGDGRARSTYFKTQIYGRIPDVAIPVDVFREWQLLGRKITWGRYGTIVIWSSNAISDMIFLRMACWRLRDFSGGVLSVNTSEDCKWHGVGVNSPEQLVVHFGKRVALDSAARESLALAFESIVERNDLLRIYSGGHIVSVGPDHFDDYVMSFAAHEWEHAARIIGNCLGHREDENKLGDGFFEWRLQTLIDEGKLESQGDRSQMRGYKVRLPANNTA